MKHSPCPQGFQPNMRAFDTPVREAYAMPRSGTAGARVWLVPRRRHDGKIALMPANKVIERGEAKYRAVV